MSTTSFDDLERAYETLAVAIDQKNQDPDTAAFFITKDTNLRIRADAGELRRECRCVPAGHGDHVVGRQEQLRVHGPAAVGEQVGPELGGHIRGFGRRRPASISGNTSGQHPKPARR